MKLAQRGHRASDRRGATDEAARACRDGGLRVPSHGVIEVEGLTKRFGLTVAVDGLSFQVQPGRVTGFLGPNGAGKSTTLRCMVDLDRPQGGATRFDGRPFTSFHEPLRHVGALLDAGYLHPTRSARNHLLAFARANRIGGARVDEVLEMVGITPVASRKAGNFSLGMRQRLGLAWAMLGDPEILLLDEPANGLDPEGIQWVRAFLKALAAQGRTVFVSSHLLGEMSLMADDLVVIGKGRLLAQTSVQEFVARSTSSWVAVRSPEAARLATLLEQQGARVQRNGDGALDVFGVEAPAVGELAFHNGVMLHELAPRTGSLEDAFLQATADAQEFRASVGAGAAGAQTATGPPLPLPPPGTPT